jgi:N-acetyl-gamma-glutamyl-phosphate reductase
MGYRVAVAGASGYAGGELLRLLAVHPELDVVAASAGGNAGQRLGAIHPGLRSLADLVLTETTASALADADLVFLALPAGASGPLAAELPSATRVIDMSGDHRLADPDEHQRCYPDAAHDPWTYGLPELPGARAQLTAVSRVANTGCYAVATILPLAPLVAAGLIEADDVVVVAASGTSGAGRAAKPHLLGSEVMGDLSPYRVGTHQHVPEIRQATGVAGLCFTPVLAPMPRGILAVATVRPAPGASAAEIRDALGAAYADEPFVYLLPAGQQPHTAATAGSNAAHLQVSPDQGSPRVIVTCAIDNLGKGAAGQAVQNANLLLGVPETTGLSVDGVAP